MDLKEFFNSPGVTVKNPNKKSKKDKEPQYITVPFDKTNTDNLYGTFNRNFSEYGQMLTDIEDPEKYTEQGLTITKKDAEFRPGTNFRELDYQLADAQSNFSKFRNALAQTIVNEIGLGTARGITDLFDATIGAAINASKGIENDYTSAASEKLKEWQEEFERYAPVYATPGANIANGGLMDFGWWMSNMPSIMSSLTLLIPSTGVAKGLSWLGKASRFGRLTGATRRALTAANKVDKLIIDGEKLNILQKASKVINNENTVKAANKMIEYGINGFTSRLMENYQEANQVYNDLLPQMWDGDKAQGIKGIKDMSEQDYQALVTRNADELKGVNTSDRHAVAKRLAKAGADRTFMDDLWNGFFDVYQLYGLRNLRALRNLPMRASIRRAHLNSLKYPGKSAKDIEAILANRSKWVKGWEKVKDHTWGAKNLFWAEASEGIEEAINYIAQEEGYHYGHVLLGSEAENNFWDTRLRDYAMAPQLYESAFWGVLGGVAFQGLGSTLAGAGRAINKKQGEKRRKQNAQTGEEIPETSWSKAFEDPEIEARKGNIEGRAIAEQQFQTDLSTIKNHQDPFNKINGTPVTLITDEDHTIARRRAEDKRITNLLFDAMAVGNYKITRAYLESDEVKQALVEQGVVTQEVADEMQERAKEIGDKIESLYNANMKAIGNAMRGTDEVTGAKFQDVPIEYFQIIAAENTKHQLQADRFQASIDEYQPAINSDETRLANELKEKGINYKEAIRRLILTKQLGEIQAEIEGAKKSIKEGRTKNNWDPRTISGQNALRELEVHKRVLTRMLYDDVDGTGEQFDEKIRGAARFLTTMRGVFATETNGEGGFRINTNTKKFKELDKAIIAAESSTESDFKNNIAALATILPNFDFSGFSLEDFKQVSHQAKVYSERFSGVFGKNDIIKDLSELSQELLNNYAQVTYNEIAKNVSLAHVAIKRSDIISLAHTKHNDIRSTRGMLLEGAAKVLKALAKHYDEELGDISEHLAYGTLRKESRDFLKEHLTDDHMATYDNIMKIISLNKSDVTKWDKNKIGETSAVNVLLPEIVKDIIYNSKRDVYEDVSDSDLNFTAEDVKQAETENEGKSEEKEKNTINKNQSSEPKKPLVNNSSEEEIKSDDEAASSQILDFTKNRKGKKLAIPSTTIKLEIDDAGNARPIKCEVYRSLDDENPDDDNYINATIRPVEGEPNAYWLDYKDDIAEERMTVEEIPQGLAISKQMVIGGELITNPKVVLKSNGEVEEFYPGVIASPDSVDAEEEERDKEEAKAAPSISSTGGQEQDTDSTPVEEDNIENEGEDKGKRPDPEAEAPTEVFDLPEDEGPEEEIDLDSLRSDVAFEAITFVKERLDKSYSEIESEFKEYFDNKYKDKIPQEDYDMAFSLGIKHLKRTATSNNIELDAVNEFIQESSILDREISEEAKREADKILDKAFEKLIKNYMKRATIDTHNGRKMINLENLLRYINLVTGDKTMGSILYDKFHKYIEDNDGKYALINTGSKEATIENATLSSEERYNLDTVVDGQNLNIGAWLWKIDNTIGKSDAELARKERERVYDIIDSLENDDELNVTVKGNYIQFSKNGVTIAENWIPTATDTHYIVTNQCWKTDIPRSNDGSIGNLHRLFYRLMLNPNNEEEIKPITEEIQKLLYDRYDYEDSDLPDSSINDEDYEHLMDVIVKTIPDVERFIDYKIYSEERQIKLGRTNYTKQEAYAQLGKWFMRVYKYSNKATQKYLNTYNMSAADYNASKPIQEKRKQSIDRWFEKLKNSYDASHAIKNANVKTVKINRLYKGGPVITTTDELHPTNSTETLGSRTREVVEVGVASIREPGKVYTAGPNGTNVYDLPTVRGGSTMLIIPREQGNPATIPLYPQSINSSDIKGEAKNIYEDIFAHLETLLNEWGTDVSRSSKKISDFLNLLCNPVRDRHTGRNTNNNLFKGVTVVPLTNGFKGINIQYQRGGKWHNIRLYDGHAKYGDCSNIQIENGKPISCKTKAKRKDVIEQLKSILGEVITYNIEFDHVNNNVRNLTGVAKRNPKGEFIVTIGGKVHKFNSYRDFILDTGVVAARTISADGKTNLKRKYNNYTEKGTKKSSAHYSQYDDVNITYRIPIAGEKTEKQKRKEKAAVIPPVRENIAIPKGSALINILEKESTSPNVLTKVAELILDNTKLKYLKNSKILQELLTNRVIFVPKVEGNSDVFAAHLPDGAMYKGEKLANGTIIVTNRIIELLNSKDTLKHEQAFRHILHECVHKKLTELTKEQKEELFETVREVFDAFVKANKEDNLNYSDYEYVGKTKYHDGDGKINHKGLEEFLIESITRPELMERLNSISVNGERIDKRSNALRGEKTKNQTLLQRILSTIMKLFGTSVHRGSLLEKEYKLFEKVANFNVPKQETKKKKTKQESKAGEGTQLEIQFPDETEINESPESENNIDDDNVPQADVNVGELGATSDSYTPTENDGMIDEDLNADLADESSIPDREVSSLSQIRDTLVPENRRPFEKFISKGIISIKC